MKVKFFIIVFSLIFFAVFANSCAVVSNSKKGVAHEIIGEFKDTSDSRIKKPNEYIIGSGDTLDIFIYNHPELTQKIVVPPSGKITYPFVGDLQAGGLTIFQLRDKLKSELAKGYVPNPQVSVNLENISGKKVYVLGEVRNPKLLYIKDEMDAIEAISQAGGFTRDAKKSGVLLIRKLESGKAIMDALNLKSFIQDGDFKQNVALRKGDILYVPPSFIANFERFMTRLHRIILPIAPDILNAIILTPRARDAIQGKTPVIQVD